MPHTRTNGFSSLTVSFFIHSTEDELMLLDTVASCFGIPNEEILTEKLEGHYGNRVLLGKCHLLGSKADQVSNEILSHLDTRTKKLVCSELEKSVDEHDALYLRIDRQTLSQELTLTSDEPIRIKLKPGNRSGGRRAVIENYRNLLGCS